MKKAPRKGKHTRNQSYENYFQKTGLKKKTSNKSPKRENYNGYAKNNTKNKQNKKHYKDMLKKKKK